MTIVNNVPSFRSFRQIESAEKERLIRQKLHLEEDLAQARQQAIELMNPGNDHPDNDEVLASVNRQAVDLSRQLTRVAAHGAEITRVRVSPNRMSPRHSLMWKHFGRICFPQSVTG